MYSYLLNDSTAESIVKSSTKVIERLGGKADMQYFLPFLFTLACPVGMGLMMWLMIGESKHQTAHEDE